VDCDDGRDDDLRPRQDGPVAQGYTALLDSASIDYQAGMGVFMAVPMVAWMRVRGHGWRMGTEMAGAMLGPTAAVLVLCALGLPDVFPWLSTRSTGPAMAIGMLAIMLYRRDHYSTGYSFIHWHPVWSHARRMVATPLRARTR